MVGLVLVKKILIVLGAIVFCLASIVMARDRILGYALTAYASMITRTPVHMDGFSLDIFSSTMRISGLKISNPVGFPEGILILCPKISIKYDPGTLFKLKHHFLRVEIDLMELGLVRNREGALNLDSFKKKPISKASPRVPISIDSLDLSLGRIVYKDYTISEEPVVRVYDVNKRKSYKNITAKQATIIVLAAPMGIVEIKKTGAYGVARLMGMSVVRAAIGVTFIGKDSVHEIVETGFEHLYDVSLVVLKRMGTITKDDAPNGAIKANINGVMVALQLRKSSAKATEITISARQDMSPKHDIAGGVLYQVLDALPPNERVLVPSGSGDPALRL